LHTQHTQHLIFTYVQTQSPFSLPDHRTQDNTGDLHKLKVVAYCLLAASISHNRTSAIPNTYRELQEQSKKSGISVFTVVHVLV